MLKEKLTLERPRRPEGGQNYNSTLSFNSSIYARGWSTPISGRFTPGKGKRYLLYRVGWSSGAGVDACGKSRPPSGFDSGPTSL